VEKYDKQVTEKSGKIDSFQNFSSGLPLILHGCEGGDLGPCPVISSAEVTDNIKGVGIPD
jgi:hypothetical protein